MQLVWVTWRDLLPTKRKSGDQRIVTTTATVSPCPDFVEWEMTVPHIFPQIITARRLYHTVTSYQIWLLEWPTPPDYWSREFEDFILVMTNWHTHLAWVCIRFTDTNSFGFQMCACHFQREKLQEEESFGNSELRAEHQLKTPSSASHQCLPFPTHCWTMHS